MSYEHGQWYDFLSFCDLTAHLFHSSFCCTEIFSFLRLHLLIDCLISIATSLPTITYFLFWHLCENSGKCSCKDVCLMFCVLFHWPTYVFLCQCHAVFLTTALHYSLNSFHSNLFVQDYLGNPWSSVSTYKFYFFSLFVKNAVGILIEIALNL